jgi:hypothetical protein
VVGVSKSWSGGEKAAGIADGGSSGYATEACSCVGASRSHLDVLDKGLTGLDWGACCTSEVPCRSHGGEERRSSEGHS